MVLLNIDIAATTSASQQNSLLNGINMFIGIRPKCHPLKKDKYQTIISSKKCKDIYHLLQMIFSLCMVEVEAAITHYILDIHFWISLEAGNQIIKHH